MTDHNDTAHEAELLSAGELNLLLMWVSATARGIGHSLRGHIAALEARRNEWLQGVHVREELIAERDALLAERQKNQETIAELQKYARQIAMSLAAKYPVTPTWEPLGDAYGMLMQIDNMTVGFLRQRDSALTTLRQVRLDVEAAPHSAGCEMFGDSKAPHAGVWEYRIEPKPERCNCRFKARVFAEIDKALGTVPEPTQEETK